MSYSRHAQGDSKTAWDATMEWIKSIFDTIKMAWDATMEWIKSSFNKSKSTEKDKNKKALESKMDEAFQDLNNKMKALHDDFKKLQENTAELEENQEEEIARVLKSMLDMNLRQISRRIQTLAEDVKEWPETTKDELQVRRAYLKMNQEKKEEEIEKTLVAMLNKNLRQLSRRIESVAEDVQDCLRTTKDELQHRRAYLERNQEKKEEEIAQALVAMLNKYLSQHPQEFQTEEGVWNVHDFLRFFSSA